MNPKALPKVALVFLFCGIPLGLIAVLGWNTPGVRESISWMTGTAAVYAFVAMVCIGFAFVAWALLKGNKFEP